MRLILETLRYASMNWVITGSGSVRHRAAIWTNAGLLSTGLHETNFSEIWIGIRSFSFKEMLLKTSSAKMAAILSRGRWVKDIRVVSAHEVHMLSVCIHGKKHIHYFIFEFKFIFGGYCTRGSNVVNFLLDVPQTFLFFMSDLSAPCLWFEKSLLKDPSHSLSTANEIMNRIDLRSEKGNVRNSLRKW